MRLSTSGVAAGLLLVCLACNKTPSSAAESPSPQADNAAASEPVAQVAPDSAAPPAGFDAPSPRQEELRGIAQAALQAGDLNLAIAASIALMETPEKSGLRASGLILLAELYYQEGNGVRGIEILEQTIAESPPVGEFHFTLGRMFGELQRFTEAETQLRRAIELRPELLQSYIYLGSTLIAAGRAEDAGPVYAQYEAALAEMLRLVANTDTPMDLRLNIMELLTLANPDDSITATMVSLLSSPELAISATAVQVLGIIGTAEAVPALQSFSQQTAQPELSDFALQAIAQIQARVSH